MSGKFKFEEMNVLLNAYEYWRYENINKQTFHQLDHQHDELINSKISGNGRKESEFEIKPKKKCGCISEEIQLKWSTMMSSP